jgi:hypothetical protein
MIDDSQKVTLFFVYAIAVGLLAAAVLLGIPPPSYSSMTYNATAPSWIYVVTLLIAGLAGVTFGVARHAFLAIAVGIVATAIAFLKLVGL